MGPAVEHFDGGLWSVFPSAADKSNGDARWRNSIAAGTDRMWRRTGGQAQASTLLKSGGGGTAAAAARFHSCKQLIPSRAMAEETSPPDISCDMSVLTAKVKFIYVALAC
jgi:hypothetical protein